MTTTINFEQLAKDINLVYITGDLDAPGGLAIKDELEAYVADNLTTCIFDLAGVNYMSSYGLRVLLTVAQILQNGGGQLHIAAPNARVMDVLAVSGYDSLFPVHHSLDDAKNSLGA